jgi:hypothetical protein
MQLARKLDKKTVVYKNPLFAHLILWIFSQFSTDEVDLKSIFVCKAGVLINFFDKNTVW